MQVAEFQEWLTGIPGIDEATALSSVIGLIESGRNQYIYASEHLLIHANKQPIYASKYLLIHIKHSPLTGNHSSNRANPAACGMV